ncbi:aldo/keto reductase [Streptomyces sp. NPDC054796]
MGPQSLGRGLLSSPLGAHCALPHGAATDGPRSAGDVYFLENLRRMIDIGSTVVDTSDSYGDGHSERLIGRLLPEYPEGRLLLSSKVGLLRGSAPHPYADRRVHHQFQQTQENLKTDHVDLYSLESFDFGPGDRYLGTVIDQMRTLRDLGDITAIGMRGPHARRGAPAEEREALAQRFLTLFDLIRPDVVWTRFDMLTPVMPLTERETLLDFTARHGVGLLLLPSPLQHRPGNVAALSEVTSHRLDALAEWQPLRRFGNAPGTLTGLALRACVQQRGNCVVLCDTTSPECVQEAQSFLRAALTSEELVSLDLVYARIRAALRQGRSRYVRTSGW